MLCYDLASRSSSLFLTLRNARCITFIHRNQDLALNRQRALRDEAELSEENGKEFGKGAWIGDVQAVMKGQPTHLEITAVREGWVFALNAHNLGAYVHRYPGLFMLIYDRLFLL